MKRKPPIPDQRGQQMSHLKDIVRDVKKGLDELDNVILEAIDAYEEYENQCDDDWPMLAEVIVAGGDMAYWLHDTRDQVLDLLNDMKVAKIAPISSR